jgi:hypothetical protein
VHDQAVHATLVTEHDHARDALVASRPSLEAALGRSNLRLEGFTVGLGQHQQGRAGRDNDDGRPAAATPGHPAPAPAATPSPDRPEADLGAGALSVRV